MPRPEGEWTIVERTDGTKMWAYEGKPLYTFIKDKKPGDVTGDGAAASGTSPRPNSAIPRLHSNRAARPGTERAAPLVHANQARMPPWASRRSRTASPVPVMLPE